MLVKIGNYPSRLTSNLFNRYMNKRYGYADWPTEYSRFERCLEWWDDRLQQFYNIFNWLWFDRRQQKVRVRIDSWDTWSMDHTLAEIVVPMLLQLKATKHGAPNVDVEDVPSELRPTKKEQNAYKKDGTTDDKFFDRWDWVLDEMIFAFEAKRQDNWQEQFYSGDIDIYWEEIDNRHSEMKRGPKDTFRIDREGMDQYQARISNGFRLFGKYYENLWD